LRSIIRSTLFIGIAIAALVIAGCGFISSHIFISSVDRIYGRYSLQEAGVSVDLELKRNMKFDETIRFEAGQTSVITGDWRFDVIEGEGDVALDGAVRLSKARRPGAIDRIDTEMEAQNWFGKVRLCADANASMYFVKVESE
jgi:hypothetical protein